MADKRHSETAQSITFNGTEKCEKQGQWSELPSLPLETIYSFLTRTDQYHMSLVCSKWSEEFGSPSVWENFTFCMTESQLWMDTCPILESVRKYSSMIRHIEIDFDVTTFNRKLICTWCRYFIEFLQILTSNSQLISVEFLDLLDCFGVIDTPKYNDMCRTIAEFLGSQHNLQRAEFHDCFFEIIDGAKLLRKLAEQSRGSLQHLVLRGFVVWESLDMEQKASFLKHLPKLMDFPSLSTFETDYSLIFEKMVANQHSDTQATKSCQTRALSKIILYYCNDMIEKEDDFDGLDSADWSFMKKLYPHLEVELLDVKENLTRWLLKFFIVPNMPISRLEYKNWTLEIDEFSYRLRQSKVTDYLVTLYLYWGNPIQDLSSTFIPFLQECKKLKHLKLALTFPFPTNGIDPLLKSWLEKPHKSLKKVVICIQFELNEEEDDYRSLIRSTTGYASILKLRGLNIKVKFHL